MKLHPGLMVVSFMELPRFGQMLYGHSKMVLWLVIQKMERKTVAFLSVMTLVCLWPILHHPEIIN
jgi:hypothetical protein